MNKKQLYEALEKEATKAKASTLYMAMRLDEEKRKDERMANWQLFFNTMGFLTLGAAIKILFFS